MKRSGKKYSLRIRMMGINVGIAFISFLLCGVLFAFSVRFFVRKYINYDLDFFLTETGGNLEKRLEYVTDTVNEVRSSEILMEYLKNGAADIGKVKSVFLDAADINDTPNHGENGRPVVDRIYLFRKQGDYLPVFYYALVPEDEEKSNRTVEEIWKGYCAEAQNRAGFAAHFYRYGDTLFLACPILDEGMEEQGSLIFGINSETISMIMEQIGNYEGAFWVIYTEAGDILENFPEDTIPAGEDWKDISRSAPYIGRAGTEEYRLYNKDLCLGLRVAFGIPENHAVRMLYDSIAVYGAGIILVMFMGIFSFGIFTVKMTRPIEEVNQKMRSVRQRDFDARLPDYDSREFHEISLGFNQMTKEIDHLIHEVYEKQILVKEMELRFLQTQMNPHFMFNVLNALGLQAKIDGNEELSRKIAAFSQLIQAKIYRSDTEKVQIRQEMEYVKYYLEIQNFRYGDSLTYSVNIEEGLEEYYIPKLCIQLVVENAVVHGLEPKMGNGSVRVVIARKDGDIQITVKDDGVGFGTGGEVALPLGAPEADSLHNRVGLNNADSIIKLMYGKEYGIRIFSVKNEGTEVKMLLPADTGES